MSRKKEWTVREAGVKGGKACKRNHAPDYYQKMGGRGGKANVQQHGPEGLAKAGRAGGLAKHRGRGGPRGRASGETGLAITAARSRSSRKADANLDRLLDHFREEK